MKKLLIVTAVCQTDYFLAEKRAKWMVEMGQKPIHTLLLINDGTLDENRAKSLAESHTGVFETVLLRKIARPKSSAWPDGVNHVFRAIARNLTSTDSFIDKNNFSGWFYFEPDVTPLVPIWADILDTQYDFQKKPFMGVKSIVHATRGKSPVKITCMNGAGCYSFDGIHYTPMMMLGEGAPWDVLGLSENQNKIAYIPDAAYALTYGITKCERKNETTFTATKTVQDGTVSQCEFELKEQILHHGCKDGSLIEILSKKEVIKNQAVADAVRERLEPVIAISRKRVTKSMERANASKEAILADYAANVGWSTLIGKYRIHPSHLKKIITEGAIAL